MLGNGTKSLLRREAPKRRLTWGEYLRFAWRKDPNCRREILIENIKGVLCSKAIKYATNLGKRLPSPKWGQHQ